MIEEIVKTFAENAIAKIQDNIRNAGMEASGKSAKSFGWRFDGKELIIYSTESYITVLETGRKPGKFAPLQPIIEWVKIRITAIEEDARSIAFAINYKLKESGSLLYQRGGNSGILSSVINEQYVSENLTKNLFDQFVTFASNQYLNGANRNN